MRPCWLLDFLTGMGVSGAPVGFTGPDLILPPKFTPVTDVTGSYRISLSAFERHYAYVNGAQLGWILVTESTHRGDLLVNSGTCVSRYGAVADILTGRPVAGANITLLGKTVRSEADGWYRLDLGCPANGTIGFNKRSYISTTPTTSTHVRARAVAWLESNEWISS